MALIHSANCKEGCKLPSNDGSRNSWLSKNDHCKWEGLSCGWYNNDRIYKIKLQGQGLTNEFTLFEFDQAESIGLASNNLSGVFTVAEGATFPELYGLFLGDNNLIGFSGGQNMKVSSFPFQLGLSHNNFEGKLNVTDFPRGTEGLSLRGNRLTEIVGLGDMKSLEGLSLDYNDFKGEFNIPEDDFPPKLRELYLSGNKLSSITGLHHLTKLQWLTLSHNSFEGEISITAEKFPLFLDELDLSHNIGLSSIIVDDDAVPNLTELNIGGIEGLVLNQGLCDRQFVIHVGNFQDYDCF